ncbi:MAG TPA: phosphatidate cytidylyltransferase [Gemmataceae bacterium]|nr:phosphatidate cytidylyltransferase [Gemmataceae bacterium]
MLQTRLWMGAILIALTVGVLVIDQQLAPWFPFLLVLIGGLAVASTVELLHLLKPAIRPSGWLCFVGIAAVLCANWMPHQSGWASGVSPWQLILGVFAAFVLLTFLVEMATFREAGNSVMRMALAVWLLGYLGLLPSFLAQMRWFSTPERSVAALALTVFVSKSCDIGAYFTGRLLGRHKMTPVLSPKKTWEGAAGGLATAVLVAILLDHFGPAPLLHGNIALEIGFGLTVGIAGMLGDLAESLIKRDCQQKDASQVIPGFGGVLDVVDAILFAAPVSYLWFQTLC